MAKKIHPADPASVPAADQASVVTPEIKPIKGPSVQTVHTEDHVKDWLNTLIFLHRAHWSAARYYEQVNIALGLATVITAAISGTTAFSTLQQQSEGEGSAIGLQVFIGMFAVIAAVLAAVQSFFKSSELSAKHKQAAQKFGKLKRELDQHLSLGFPADIEKRDKILTDFRLRWDVVDEESLPIPPRFFDRAKEESKRHASHK
jgi:hypothetical protein